MYAEQEIELFLESMRKLARVTSSYDVLKGWIFVRISQTLVNSRCVTSLILSL